MMTLESKFQELKIIWQKETCYLSSITAITNHWAYIEIINLGLEVIPFILKDLQKESNWWFTALQILTDADPIQEEDYGCIGKMTDTWVEWGKKNGYI